MTEPGYTPANLRALIERSGLTQAAAADMIGVNHKTMRRWLVEDLDSPAHSDMPLRKWRALMEKQMAKSSTSSRRAVAVESFKTAAECIGPVAPGMSLFAITRGQFSMIDAVMHVLDQVGPAKLSIWTWAIADYELLQFSRLQEDGRITDGLLVIDNSARKRNSEIIREWQHKFGAKSVRYVMNHSKIATIEGNGFKVLLRGSMNLNFNPRFEQLDVTEGGPDFDLVKEIESEIPWLPNNASHADCQNATRVGEAFEQQTLDMFAEVKTWAK